MIGRRRCVQYMNEFSTPLLPRITFHASTRSRYDVRNGAIRTRSSMYFRFVPLIAR